MIEYYKYIGHPHRCRMFFV